MYQRVNCLSGLLYSGGQKTVLRNIRALVIKRINSTKAVTDEVPDEWHNAKSFEDIPGPKPLPIVGNAWRFIPYIGDFGKDFTRFQASFHENYGIISKLTHLPGRTDLVIVYDPEEVEKVFRNEGPLPIRDTIESILYYRTVTRKEFFEGVGGGIVSQGEEWQKFRSKMNPIMMQPKATKIYVAPIDAVASDFIARIRLLRDDKQEMPADFRNELFKWALESIIYIALDKRLGCLASDLHPDSEPQKMIDTIQVILDSIFKLDLLPSLWKTISVPTWRRFVKASDYFNEIAMKFINEAMERLKNMPENSDRELTVLEKLLIRDPNPKTGIVMALDMMVAGVDTTSYTTAIFLYFLSKNQDKQEKLFQELQQHLPNKDQPITAEILNDLKYFKACHKESMRMKPIAIGTVRKMVKNMVIAGYRVPKGIDVMAPSSHLSTMEKYFPQADKYIPERWLKNEDGTSADTKMTHPFVYMPFGFGPRMCLGRRFAELEVQTLVAKIVRNFHVRYDYDMKFGLDMFYKPVSPLKYKFVERN